MSERFLLVMLAAMLGAVLLVFMLVGARQRPESWDDNCGTLVCDW